MTVWRLLVLSFIVTVALLTELIVNQFVHLAVVAPHWWQGSVKSRLLLWLLHIFCADLSVGNISLLHCYELPWMVTSVAVTHKWYLTYSHKDSKQPADIYMHKNVYKHCTWWLLYLYLGLRINVIHWWLPWHQIQGCAIDTYDCDDMRQKRRHHTSMTTMDGKR